MKANKRSYTPPLLSLDFYLGHYHDLMRKLKVDSDLRKLNLVLGKLLNVDLQKAVE